MKRSIAAVICAFLLLFTVSCGEVSRPAAGADPIRTYRDIPGITDAEIGAIEALVASRPAFTYGQMEGTESFILPDGTCAGFAAGFCDLLSRLFGAEFKLELYDWDTLKSGIDGLRIDFTGDLTPTPERMRTYFMTHPIAERSLRVFQNAESPEIQTAGDVNGLNVGSLTGTIDTEHVLNYYPDLSFNVVDAESFEAAARMLRTGEIDLFVTEGVIDPFFDRYDYIKSKEFFPLVYTSVSLTTADPELRPIIDAVNKYLSAGGIDRLFALYGEGNDQYARTKLGKSFTGEETAYLQKLAAENRPVKIALEQDNYPVCFYNKAEKAFQGIAVDVLARIGELTGLTFEVVNDADTTWAEILGMLRSGEVSLVSQLISTEERKGSFLWPDTPYASARYALLSKSDYPNLAIYQVVRTKVGVIASSAFEDKYNEWFPGNDNIIAYDSQNKMLDALENGEIDLLMGSDYLLLMQQNYREKPGFKINIRFSAPTDSYFGFNIGEALLCSIVSKAQFYVNSTPVIDDWTGRTYDYMKTLAQQRSVYFLIIASALAAVLALAVVFLVRNRRANIRLDKKVGEMTLDLRESLMESEAANKAKSAFLSTMSHEIRTPMNAILGITEIQLQNKALDGGVREALDKIYASGDLLLGIINDILDLSKIEAGKLELLPAKYEMASFISDTAQLNMMRIGGKPIEFELFVDETMPAYLFGDELRVKQILNNILSNAFKYTAEGTVKLTVSAERAGGDTVTLTAGVSDTGQGMTKEQVDRLFDEYSRFNMEANRTTEGTGLGMSITRNLVRLMNGEISIESEPGKGSVFTVRLPQGVAGGEALGKETADNLHQFRTSSRTQMKRLQVTRDPMPYGSVLIVDDVETNVYVAKGLMTPYRLRIDSADSGFAAIEKIKSGHVYDIVFMDHMMPKMDGIEAAKRIRGMGYTAPIVALTANAVAGQADIFLGNGFDGFISKPIDVQRLDVILNKLIRDKQPPEVIEEARRQAGEPDGGEAPPAIDPAFAEIFIRDARKAMEVLEAAAAKTGPADESELRAYVIHAHGIKSALANIGKAELSAEALKLETAGREGTVMAAETAAFLRGLRAVVAELTPEEETAGDGEEDRAYLREKLLAVKAACEDYDGAAAGEALAELRAKNWSRPAKELLNAVSEQLLHSDFEEIAASVGAYIGLE